MDMLALILVLFLQLVVEGEGACFHCLSPDAHLAPTLRRQLKTQTDIFFWQIGTQWNACSAQVDVMNPSVEGQICSKYQMCVTLQPNIENSTFVVRGCLENVLRYNLREDERLHKEGCYLVRSLPMYPNEKPMDYVLCVCLGDYCNGEEANSYVEPPYSFERDTLIQLHPPKDLFYEGRKAPLTVAQTSSSPSFSLLFIIYLFICIVR